MSRKAESFEQDATRRIAAAEAEFKALLQRHRVEFGIEQGESTLAGKFIRIVFFVPRPAPVKGEPIK